MERTKPTQQWGLLVIRGVMYISIGVLLFIFSNSYSLQTAQIAGILAGVAGILGLIFSIKNQQADKNHIWGILHGVLDIFFGVALFVFAMSSVRNFTDMLGFWATTYAFLQAVQSMYLFMTSKGTPMSNYPGKIIHFLNVLVAGLFAYSTLIRPMGIETSLNFVGAFPIALGLLIIVLSQQLKAHYAH